MDRIVISKHSFAVALGALALASAALLLFAIGGVAKAGAATTCPSFRVLHNDRIGSASLPAGNYSITISGTTLGLSCKDTSTLFARFLEDYDGNLPGGWEARPSGPGKVAFNKGGASGFVVSRTGGEGGGNNPLIGQLCPTTFTVNARATAAGLVFPQGRYLLYRPAGSLISCNRAAVLFNRFLAQPGGRLPFPWQLKNQTATFYKPEHPLRSAFRVEPYAGT